MLARPHRPEHLEALHAASPPEMPSAGSHGTPAGSRELGRFRSQRSIETAACVRTRPGSDQPTCRADEKSLTFASLARCSTRKSLPERGKTFGGRRKGPARSWGDHAAGGGLRDFRRTQPRRRRRGLDVAAVEVEMRGMRRSRVWNGSHLGSCSSACSASSGSRAADGGRHAPTLGCAGQLGSPPLSWR
jgi:hypothetical protein